MLSGHLFGLLGFLLLFVLLFLRFLKLLIFFLRLFISKLLSLFLLCLCQRCELTLKKECLFHIFSKTKPENDIVAQLDTLILLVVHRIQNSQLIRPFLIKIFSLVRLENLNFLIQRRLLKTRHLIQKNVSALIVRRNATEFIEIILRLVIAACL